MPNIFGLVHFAKKSNEASQLIRESFAKQKALILLEANQLEFESFAKKMTEANQLGLGSFAIRITVLQPNQTELNAFAEKSAFDSGANRI